MKSMTGYGKGCAAEQGTEITVELRAVNNRFLEINSRIPKSFLACDELIRQMITKSVARGSVDVYFTHTTAAGEGSLSADMPMIARYQDLANQISAETGIQNDLSFTVLLSKGLVSAAAQPDSAETVLELTKIATQLALDGLDKMRQTEGFTIFADLCGLSGEIGDLVGQAERRAPQVVDEYRKRLTERIKECLDGVAVDEARLLTEVAVFSDRADINEELSRLKSHLSQFADTLRAQGTLGRKLDFISQEIGREVNTLGSKSGDITLTGITVEMKNILEKIKEQIRNVE